MGSEPQDLGSATLWADFGLRPDSRFRPKLWPQKADLGNSDTKMHSATRRVFWDASRRRRSPPEAETAEIRRPLWLQPRVVRRAGFRNSLCFFQKESQEAFGLCPRCLDLRNPASYPVAFSAQDGPQMALQWPRWRVLRSHNLQDGSPWPNMAPETPPRWPKMPPSWPKTPPERSLEAKIVEKPMVFP